jgi:signal transduction histidine kinase/CheY-like chemotaxis protein
MVPDVSKTARFSNQFDQISNFTTRSILCVPLHTKGQTIGAIEALNKAGKFDDDDLRLLSSLASLAAGGIENARLFKQAQQEITERKRAEEALQVTVQHLETAHNQAMVYAQELNAEIIERKRAEEALEKERALLAQRVAERTADLKAANEELAQAARLKDEFLASMSHELRTPLSAVLGLSEVIRGEIYGPVNEKQRKALSDIEDSGRHLLSLINDILDLSKIGAGKLELQLDRVAVAPVCQASLQMIEDEARRKDIEVSSKLDTAVTMLQADERRLKQILVNLLSNAVKFTPDGGAVGLEVTGAAERDEVDFIVWDTGIGISPEGLNHLFQPFMQLNAGLARQYPGTGLGLALVHRMVELHQGRIVVESEQGRGSRFTVSLPWRAQSQSPAPASPEAQTSVVEIAVPRSETVPAAAPARPHTASTVPDDSSDHQHLEPQPPAVESPLILLAEDDQKLAIFMKNYLTAKHYRVILAGNGLAAVELARREQPDLILMDVQMPDIDGLEATRRIRAEGGPDLAGVPIIALTALAMSGDRERCLEAGANHYLSKPIKLKELAQAIEIQLIKNQLSKKG